MREKIDWSLYNTVFKNTPNSLCVGEEMVLKDEEITAINAGLCRMNEAYSSFIHLFGEAEKRFRASKS